MNTYETTASCPLCCDEIAEKDEVVIIHGVARHADCDMDSCVL